jgi:hypothetical protein
MVVRPRPAARPRDRIRSGVTGAVDIDGVVFAVVSAIEEELA